MSSEEAVREVADARPDREPRAGHATRATKDAALHAMADALLAAAPTILAANAEDVARAEAAARPANIVDRLRLDDDRLARWPQGLRDVAGLPDPVGEVRARQHAGQRARAAPGPGAVRRGRDDLRGAAQRHRRRRRHLPQVRQRGAAARLVQRARPATPRSSTALRDALAGSRPARGRRTAGARGHPRQRQGADARPRAGRRADPARRRGPDPQRRRGVDGAGDRDRRRQLPRLRRRLGRPRAGARDRAQRQDPPHQRLQRGRVAAGARATSPTSSCRASSRRCRRPGSRSTATPRSRSTTTWCRRPTRTTPRSTSRSTSPRPWWPTSRARSTHIRRFSRGHTEAIVARDQAHDPALRRRRRLGRGAGQRLHALHRRRRVRLRRRDRHLAPRSCTPAARWGCRR